MLALSDVSYCRDCAGIISVLISNWGCFQTCMYPCAVFRINSKSCCSWIFCTRRSQIEHCIHPPRFIHEIKQMLPIISSIVYPSICAIRGLTKLVFASLSSTQIPSVNVSDQSAIFLLAVTQRLFHSFVLCYIPDDLYPRNYFALRIP